MSDIREAIEVLVMFLAVLVLIFFGLWPVWVALAAIKIIFG